MRRVLRLLAASFVVTAGAGSFAIAADMPVKTPVYKAPAAAAAYRWDGVYVGVAAGGNWGNTSDTWVDSGDPANVGLQPDSHRMKGVLVGGTLGANWQSGSIVYGVEGDFSWTNKRGDSNLNAPFNTDTNSETRERWIATVRARAGYATGRYLIFATGGGAFAEVKETLTNPTLGVFTDSKTRAGWTAGGGVEAKINDRWSVKAEYLYVKLSDADYFPPFLSSNIGTVSNELHNHIVRVGVNYRFGAAPFGGK